jgi:hypothetical protein
VTAPVAAAAPLISVTFNRLRRDGDFIARLLSVGALQ